MNADFFVILNETEYSGNAGAVARLMGNYNFKNLIMVKPLYRNEYEGGKLAHTDEGISIFNKKKVFNTLPEAIKKLKLNYTIGFTRRSGKTREIFTDYRSYFKELSAEKNKARIKIGLIFGNEDTGITEKDTEYCSTFLYIPTSNISPSLNLSHSVCVILNEIFQLNSKNKRKTSNLAFDAKEIFQVSALTDREKFYDELILAASQKKLFIRNDRKTFKRMFERIFCSPVITKKDLKLLKNEFLRFLFADEKE
jgi:TrmH family RNA methyltransferase